MARRLTDYSRKEKLLSSALKLATDPQRHAWFDLQDISAVSEDLDAADEAFLIAVGRVLNRTKQTARFALTLLHRHFNVEADEVLVETPAERGRIITTVRCRREVSEDELTPKSWMFTGESRESAFDAMRVISWTSPSCLERTALRHTDALLLQALAAEFRRHGNAIQKFGMCLVGERPREGFIWSEGTSVAERLLVQQQAPIEEIEKRNPVRTLWYFDPAGRHTITLGCCVQLTAKRGHAGIAHRKG
jgi:hypothetical protein